MQSIFGRSRHICWGNYYSRSLKIQSFGGETVPPADVAITRPSLWGLPQFGSVVFEEASSFWQTGKLSNDAKSGLYGEMGRISLPSGASNACSGNVVQEQYSWWQPATFRFLLPRKTNCGSHFSICPLFSTVATVQMTLSKSAFFLVIVNKLAIW